MLASWWAPRPLTPWYWLLGLHLWSEFAKKKPRKGMVQNQDALSFAHSGAGLVQQLAMWFQVSPSYHKIPYLKWGNGAFGAMLSLHSLIPDLRFVQFLGKWAFLAHHFGTKVTVFIKHYLILFCTCRGRSLLSTLDSSLCSGWGSLHTPRDRLGEMRALCFYRGYVCLMKYSKCVLRNKTRKYKKGIYKCLRGQYNPWGILKLAESVVFLFPIKVPYFKKIKSDQEVLWQWFLVSSP